MIALTAVIFAVLVIVVALVAAEDGDAARNAIVDLKIADSSLAVDRSIGADRT